MAGSSKLYKGEFVISDSTKMTRRLNPPDKGKGLELGLRSTPFGEIPGAPPFPSSLLIPEGEFQARIKELEDTKSRLSDIATSYSLACKDQGQTNYCWINAPVYAFELIRAIQGQPITILSPASAGARIKGYRNVGGWGQEGLEFIAEHGLVPVNLWPANAINQQYATASNVELAKNHYRCTEWMELQPRNMHEMISCLLHRMPVAVGYNWWGHEVTAVDAVWLDGQAWPRIRNSWGMSWGSQGYGVLQGGKAPADDAVVPNVAQAS